MNILIADFEKWDSGITSYALAVAESMKNKNHNVIFASISGKTPAELARKRKIKTSELPSSVSLFALRRIIKDNAVKVLNVHDGKSHVLALLLKIISGGVRIVRTYADARPVRKHRFLWNDTDAFIAAAEFIKDDFLKKGLPPEKINVIYQGADENFCGDDEPVNLGGKYNVSIVGRLDPVKGHETFIKAAALVLKNFPEVFFYVIGAEKNVSINHLKIFAEKYEVKNIVFTGFVENVKAYMKTSDIGVIASTGSEAVSRAAVEWMSCGKPLVVTSAGCLSELVKNEITGLVVKVNDHAAMAAAIERLLKDASVREDMGRSARKRAEVMFAYGKFAENTEKILKGET